MRTYFIPLFGIFMLISFDLNAQLPVVEYVLKNPENEPAPVHPLPHPRQLKWQEVEYYAFFHYGMNTYTGLEWGYGDEDCRRFAPEAEPDVRQWLEVAKKAGMKGGIAVAKHHDGFCLWPTQTTDHNVSNSGNDFGRNVNIPADFASAARELGLEYGFYVSPWDRNSVHYGEESYVSDVFLRQCAELAAYGDEQFEMWLDGANGGDGYYGGRNTTVKVDSPMYYDIPNLRDSIHKLCPDCVLWGMGGDARWIGNEAGWAGETNWAMRNRGGEVYTTNMVGCEDGWAWMPGESDAKATDKGWFWHDGQKPLSPERVFQMYLETVGRNSTLILNLPPDKSGLIPEETACAMIESGNLIKERLGKDLAPDARIKTTDVRKPGRTIDYRPDNMTDGDKHTYWAANDGVKSAVITLTWKIPQTVRYVELMEYIPKGQRVRKFRIETSEDGRLWTPRAEEINTTTIGYKRIIPLNGSTEDSYGDGYTVRAMRITIEDSRACPLISKLGVY